jgi:uncharacterized small protein (TIGR04563 family)
MTDRRKQSIYLPAEMRAEMQREAERLDRPLSWVVQESWRIAREQLMKAPAPPSAQKAA